MRYFFKQFLNLLILFFKSFIKASKDTILHDGIEHAGYLSFLLMLSILPFIFFLMSIITFVIPENLSEQITRLILDHSSINLDDLIYFLKPSIRKFTSNFPSHNILTFSILSSMWTASSIFEGIRTILNRANRVLNPPCYLFRRFISIVELIIVISFTIVAICFFGIFPLFISSFTEKLNINHYNYYSLEQGARYVKFLSVSTYNFVLLSFLYYFLPNKKVGFLRVIPGCFLVLIFWYLFTHIFKYYISSFLQMSMIYGSIAGIIITLLYFYCCSIIFIFGAEFNYHLSRAGTIDRV